VGQSKAGILVVEDDETIRLSLEVGLVRAGYDVRAEADGRNLDDALSRFVPDLAILDVRLPVGPNGFAIARRLRADSQIPILFLTAAESLRDRLEGFEAGADDYQIKPYQADELLARIKRLLQRSGRTTAEVWRVRDLVVDDATRVVTLAGAELALTRTEYDLLAVLVQHRGQILSTEQLFSRVWGYGSYEPNRVQVHLNSLRRKLEASGPRLLHTVRGCGYVIRP